MKISSIPNKNYEVGPNQRSLVSQTAKNASFKGLGDVGKSLTAGAFKSIEKGGFFIQFLIVDTLSMVLPRTLVGLNRDKEKLGHPNYQAGAEEFGRELLSGPSMNLIPMALASIAVRKMMPSIKVDQGTLLGINHSFENVVKNSKDLTDKSAATKKLAEQIFDDAFGGEEFKGYKTKFVETLQKATESKPRLALTRKLTAKNPDAFDSAEKEFDALVVEMNNKTAKGAAPIDSHNITLKMKNAKGEIIGSPTSSQTFFEDFHNYSKDYVEKFMKSDKKDVANFLKKAAGKTSKSRMGLAALAFFAVGGFLLYLPKIYQLSKVSPAAQSAQRAQDEVAGGANEGK